MSASEARIRAPLSSRRGAGDNRPRRGTRLANALRLSLGIAVSLGCLYFATQGTDWSQVGAVLQQARPAWLVVVVVATLATVYIRAQRWRILLRPLGDVPLYPVLSATAIGFGASSVLPFRLGEFVRPALLGRRAGVSMSGALSSVVIERLFDMLLVIGCFLAVSLIYPEVPPNMRRGAFVLAALAALGFGVLLLMQRHRERSEAILERLIRLLPERLARRLRPLVASFMNGLGGLADASTVLLVLWYSAYLWGVITLTFLFSFLALPFGSHIPLVAASLTTVVIVAAAVFLPQAPGYVGTWQAGCVLALGLFGVSKEVAIGYSLLSWIVQMGTNIGVAGIFLAREDISLAQLLRVAERGTGA
ncbi:MAG TPA: lysylphosphatidylglycerol synthase transmembrane domain-containing protein [Candidatus Binatia bacterium]|nr:lysylphosphatidylglycerol synthase transmembrane domain-containing protein [Candidatus Binatia bacterium]